MTIPTTLHKLLKSWVLKHNENLISFDCCSIGLELEMGHILLEI